MTDIGANTLFLSVYYGISLLRNEFTVTSSIHMKSVPYGEIAVSPNGNEIGWLILKLASFLSKCTPAS